MIVVWRITERCNLACPFCAYDRTLNRSRNEADPRQVEAFGAVLGAYQATTGDHVLLSLLGGEPLLWSPLAALEKDLHELCMLRLGITTNGTTLGAPEVRTRLLQSYAEVTVSVDGLAGTHDRLRTWPGGFAALREAVLALAEEKRHTGAGPKLRANTVVMRDNVAEFPALCAELATWGIEEITFNRLGGRDRPAFYPLHRLNEAAFSAFTEKLPDLRARLAAAGVRLAGSKKYLWRLLRAERGEAVAVEDCGPGERFLFIDENGVAAPCSFTGDECGVSLAEVWTVAALRALPARFAALRRARTPAICRDCPSTQFFGKFDAQEGA